ncbi:MAG: hypothetical protein C0622_10075 [Desulfuromonas sp.]|nr:MAG: hypothetical protein C0622_10075 [Desulfuromonas sp.]
MNKGSVFLIVITLVVGVLIGVIYSNWKKDTASPAPAPAMTTAVQGTATAPVNQQQQIDMLEGIVAREPGNRNAWVQLGHNLFDANQPMKAIDAYAKALAIEGNDPNILTDQGIMYRRVGWYDKAIANFEKANKLDPSHQQCLYNLGIVYRYDLQDFAKAAEAWERFLALNPVGPGADRVRADLEFLRQHPTPPQSPQ